MKKLTHVIDVRSILAEASLIPFLEKLVEDPLNSLTLLLIRLVEAEHADENSMSSMHEEVSHSIETLILVDFRGALIPLIHHLSIQRNDGRVSAMSSST